MNRLIYMFVLFFALQLQAEYVDESEDIDEGRRIEELSFIPGQSRIDMGSIDDEYYLDLINVYNGVIEEFKAEIIKIPCCNMDDEFIGYREALDCYLTIQDLKTGERFKYWSELAIIRGLEAGFPVKVYVYTLNNGYLSILIECNNRFWEVFGEE